MARRIDALSAGPLAAVPVALAVLLFPFLAVLIVPAAIAAAVDPPNTPPSGLHRCSTHGAVTASCLEGALKDYKRARAKEGLAPMTVPSNFTRLSIPGQLLVLADLDRVDRGLAPVAGLSSNLQPYAQAGADHSGDPAFPAWAAEGGSNWASTPAALWAEFLWMYDDGPGAGNLDCTGAGSSGCYGHRHNVLTGFDGPILMGAGSGAGGATQLLLGRDRHDAADLLPWTTERRLIPVGVSKHHLKHGGRLTVWASGRAMKVHAKATGGWHVSRKHLHLKAGHQATLNVTGRGHGTLRLKGPNGTVTVALGR